MAYRQIYILHNQQHWSQDLVLHPRLRGVEIRYTDSWIISVLLILKQFNTSSCFLKTTGLFLKIKPNQSLFAWAIKILKWLIWIDIGSAVSLAWKLPPTGFSGGMLVESLHWELIMLRQRSAGPSLGVLYAVTAEE